MFNGREFEKIHDKQEHLSKLLLDTMEMIENLTIEVSIIKQVMSNINRWVNEQSITVINNNIRDV